MWRDIPFVKGQIFVCGFVVGEAVALENALQMVLKKRSNFAHGGLQGCIWKGLLKQVDRIDVNAPFLGEFVREDRCRVASPQDDLPTMLAANAPEEAGSGAN